MRANAYETRGDAELAEAALDAALVSGVAIVIDTRRTRYCGLATGVADGAGDEGNPDGGAFGGVLGNSGSTGTV